MGFLDSIFVETMNSDNIFASQPIDEIVRVGESCLNHFFLSLGDEVGEGCDKS